MRCRSEEPPATDSPRFSKERLGALLNLLRKVKYRSCWTVARNAPKPFYSKAQTTQGIPYADPPVTLAT
ncbi:hypothetical protein [Rhodothermus profundi]|uniref:hypothetical protein n=1 Tax=Rhodothermus profundi TaxID=633813 RepID=UPI0011602636|nr:hypothetical protein [Rhodothermus profundi]